LNSAVFQSQQPVGVFPALGIVVGDPQDRDALPVQPQDFLFNQFRVLGVERGSYFVQQ
jgi:hypothetical protein